MFYVNLLVIKGPVTTEDTRGHDSLAASTLIAQVWELSSFRTPFAPPPAKSNQNLHFAFLQWLSSLVACLVLALYIETIWNSLYIDLKTQISTYAYHTPQTAQILHRKSKKIQNRNLLKLIFKKVLFTFIRIWKFLY